MSGSTLDADDEEIVEIFVEEAEEVLQELDRHLKTLKTQPRDRNALAEVRRGFHTLKGSGRMAKALDLGELAWKIENMLNRVIEGKITVSEPMISLIVAARGAMPRLLDAFKHHRKPDGRDELDEMMQYADALASGQAPASAARRAAAAAPAPAGDTAGIQGKLNELQRLLEQTARRADESLQRSEMALQQTRRLAGQFDSLAAELQDRRGGGEIKPLTERVNALGRDIQELRLRASMGGSSEAAPNPKELQHFIDQRVRERLAASERAKQELERKLDEALQGIAAARNLGRWALILALLLLAGAIGAAAFLYA